MGSAHDRLLSYSRIPYTLGNIDHLQKEPAQKERWSRITIGRKKLASIIVNRTVIRDKSRIQLQFIWFLCTGSLDSIDPLPYCHLQCHVNTAFTSVLYINPLTPNDHHSGRTAPLTSKRCILYIYSTNICTAYFKHGIHSPRFSLQNTFCFIILTYLVPVLFTFYIQDVLKLKQ